ncbi:two-component system response regulator [Elizabethkingia meningoseptica]|uniref:LytR/AlgR family response regulator transcription factor n=1 Tax=Elizabethkingia meningoseptica TaxID=238 RepID=UPI000332D23D|nr:LytTR family DNA-binding domain-containing protein [Elizabethkingia meningoseptica]AQX06862.1 DNA-binding response regulator [Elizabethkingia meningoseptica]AQX48908.1 two-component system response regulator [Elizabethkingia meningoseptica]EOR29428.1 LytTR family two component transcriptional regulator [Elizabethkingia meningoseptica ATCC 13253 = NBRC 12535]KUY14994.1 two-component system response regulator [Elizabethkingia meningoseptica]OPB69635.1 DNA-binding response regulator [Elizabeth
MINCIIVDDEPLAIQLLENHISKVVRLNLTGTAKNALEAYQLLQTKPVDLIFLDIHMPDLNGIDFMKSLKTRPKTIFTTAYREFAVEGFELEAVDYILKPVTFERFFRSVERVLRNNFTDSVQEPNAFIVVKSEGIQRKVSIQDIIYIESQGNDIKIILKDHVSFLAKSSITDMEQRLSDKGFVRIHRSFIINSAYITAFGNSEAVLGTFAIPVGRSHKKEFDYFINTLISKKL